MNAVDAAAELTVGSEADSLGGHPALDLLNTVQQLDGRAVDLWQTDADVGQWLVRHGFAEASALPVISKTALLDVARDLRETARANILERMAARAPDVSRLNVYLAHARRHTELVTNEQGGLSLAERYARNTAEQILAPLAESVARLLSEPDFSLVKQCASADCTLCFYDRTKAHRRRWCSMALCGNRQKVKAFRQRQSA
ncbi:MAG: CGNR zinc finger domain-containing protein [Janthinobacterium lividum]